MPPREPAGPYIPDGVRKALLSWFAQNGVTPTTLWENLIARETYGTWNEMEADIRARFGDEEGDFFGEAMAAHRERERHRMVVPPRHINSDAEPALLAIPAGLFLDVLESGVSTLGGAMQYSAVNEINRVFTKRGVTYRFGFNGRAEWHGDQGAYEQLLRPALDALVDARLAGCQSEFHAAMEHLRKATPKDYEDAIEEAGKAVESAMKVLLDERGIVRTGKETATPLFEKLRDSGIVEAEADNVVLGAARVRNQWGGHGSGAAPRDPPADLAELSVRAAAVAIVFLSGRLP